MPSKYTGRRAQMMASRVEGNAEESAIRKYKIVPICNDWCCVKTQQTNYWRLEIGIFAVACIYSLSQICLGGREPQNQLIYNKPRVLLYLCMTACLF